MLAGVVALAIFTLGCGSGDEADTAAGDTTEEVQLTKTQLVKQADAACTKQNETLTTHFGEYSLDNPIKEGELTKAQSEEFSEEFFIPYVESRIELMQELNVPAAEQAELEAIITATEDGLMQAKENVESGSMTNQDPLAKAEALSRKFGFKICGET
jgi:hypothetical protein